MFTYFDVGLVKVNEAVDDANNARWVRCSFHGAGW